MYRDFSRGGSTKASVESLLSDPAYEDRDGYRYLVSPIESFPSFIDPSALEAMADLIIEGGLLERVDLIVCVEAMGISLSTVLSLKSRLPLSIIRKKEFTSHVEASFKARTNYAERTYYVYGRMAGQRVLVLDDIMASGRTIRHVVAELRALGATVQAVVSIFARRHVDRQLEAELGLRVVSLANVD